MFHTAGATADVTSKSQTKTCGREATKSSEAACICFVNKFLDSNMFPLVVTAKNKTKASPQRRTFLQTLGYSLVSELTR